MEKYKIKINKLEILNDTLIINNKFTANIIKGSVNFIIYNQAYEEINLSSLKENNLITIYGVQKKTKNIIIKKIIVKNNYVFHSDSSEELSDFD
jgi:hypothetical protein